MKKDLDHLEWNQQDRRRKGRANMTEYQKAMRVLRRTFGVRRDLAHLAAIGATIKPKGLVDESSKKK